MNGVLYRVCAGLCVGPNRARAMEGERVGQDDPAASLNTRVNLLDTGGDQPIWDAHGLRKPAFYSHALILRGIVLQIFSHSHSHIRTLRLT